MRFLSLFASAHAEGYGASKDGATRAIPSLRQCKGVNFIQICAKGEWGWTLDDFE
jgi:hypothetical protein